MTVNFISHYAAAAAILIAGAAQAQEAPRVSVGNFGLPGLVDLPTARALPDAELILTQQLHRTLERTGASFQILPNLGVAFRYSGHGEGGGEANGRLNHDRSFDAHLTLWREGRRVPGVAIGLRDFIGTGWYSSEYIVATKSVGQFELTGGLGFGRLADRDSFENPLAKLSDRFSTREANVTGRGGTLGTINWFQGKASAFGGVNYALGDRVTLSAEYTPDLMRREAAYLDVSSPWNFGASYQLNSALSLSAQYLHGSTLSMAAYVALNPKRPPHGAGRETAPVPMRLRGFGAPTAEQTDEATIRKVLAVDGFEVIALSEDADTIRLDVKNTRYRSTAQALGRAAATLQRFAADRVTRAVVVFREGGLQAASYAVDLDRAAAEQFGIATGGGLSSVSTNDAATLSTGEAAGARLTWGLSPYLTQRLFNPDLPLSVELGLEARAKFKITRNLSLDGAVRKSLATNLTENNRAGHGASRGIPTTQSDWGLYDINGQPGHIHRLSLNYADTLAPDIFARAHAGLLEPFWAGAGGELLYMPAGAPIALGLDIHRVRKRDYAMRLALRDYETTTGHVSAYIDAGGAFDLEVNAGRYLAGDWGATAKISRQFANGWEVGGYATLTDVPFEDFGEGSFDKGIYIKIPMDWLTGEPDRARRYFEIRPITKDGGARLATARQLYQQVRGARDAQLQRERGRLWK